MVFEPPGSKKPASAAPPARSPAADGKSTLAERPVSNEPDDAPPDAVTSADFDRRIQRAELLGQCLLSHPDRSTGRSFVQRAPADFQPADLPFYNFARSPARDPSDDVPWYDFRVHVDEYKVLAPDQHQQRKDLISSLEDDIQAWQAAFDLKLPEQQAEADVAGKRAALQVAKTMVHGEWQELEAFGSALDENTQQIRSPRLKLDYVLEAIREGKKVVRDGEQGLYVRKIQRSLADLGHLALGDISGTFDGPTRTAVRAFQAGAGIPETGIVDATTMESLDTAFTTYRSEAALATAHAALPDAVEGTEYDVAATPPELLAETHVLSVAEKPMVEQAIRSGGAVAVGGADPVFQPDIPAGNYKVRVKARTNQIVDDQYQRMGHGKAARRADPANLFQAADIDRVATAAKARVDAVVGKYARSPALQYGVSILDKWEFEEGRIAASAAYGDNMAKWRVRKVIQGHRDIKAIDREHGAVQSRATERGLLGEIVDEIFAVKRDRLLETHKGWPASAGGGQIKLQRFKGANDRANRLTLWKLFQTVIHEYTHTLEHSASVAYRGTLDQQAGSFTIREGFTDYFTRIVWHNTAINDALRQDIEGALYDAGDPIVPPRLGGYKEADQAERVAAIIGFENLAAAYFLGHVDRLQHT